MTCGGFCGGASGPPPIDDCEDIEQTDGITALEIGAPNEGEFDPFEDGEGAELQLGGQGATMFMYRLRIHGTNLPGCIDELGKFSTQDGDSAESRFRVRTHEDKNGGRSTEPVYIILDNPPQFSCGTPTIEAKVGHLVRAVPVAIGTEPCDPT